MNIPNEIVILENLILTAKNLQIEYPEDTAIEFMIAMYVRRIAELKLM